MMFSKKQPENKEPIEFDRMVERIAKMQDKELLARNEWLQATIDNLTMELRIANGIIEGLKGFRS